MNDTKRSLLRGEGIFQLNSSRENEKSQQDIITNGKEDEHLSSNTCSGINGICFYIVLILDLFIPGMLDF